MVCGIENGMTRKTTWTIALHHIGSIRLTQGCFRGSPGSVAGATVVSVFPMRYGNNWTYEVTS